MAHRVIMDLIYSLYLFNAASEIDLEKAGNGMDTKIGTGVGAMSIQENDTCQALNRQS